ncbi:MAG: biopolymer transporter ExbD [Calditrichaeota bacterium]|nr:biopolymer transporter ExbD [Calditrichota bacterium]
MAFKPSLRSSRVGEQPEMNMFPMMNLMVVLIPLLLSTAQIVKLGVIDLNLPPAVSGKSTSAAVPQETEKKLDLAVTITDQGFFLSSSAAVLSNEKGEGPSIPLKDGKYDFAKLSETLYQIKQKVKGKFKDDDRIIVLAEPQIRYQTVVSTMDAARSFRRDGKEVTLFPDVAVGAGVL